MFAGPGDWEGPLPVPNLFVIGAPKCGTTSLYMYLKGHPQVHMSPTREPNYFAADLAHDPARQSFVYGRDGAAYLRLFERAGTKPIVGEASTRYLSSRRAPMLIRAASPEARIVAMVRNPVDMLRSLHAHKLAAGTEDIADFEHALAADLDRRSGRRIPARANPLLATYRDRARYGELLLPWFETFGPQSVHVIVLEDVVRQPDLQFERLLDFLAVDPAYRPPAFKSHNSAHRGRNVVKRLTSTPPAQWLAWRALPSMVGDIRARELVSTFSHSRLRRSEGLPTEVAPELRARLESEYEADVSLLGQLLQRDLARLWFGQPDGALPDDRPAALVPLQGRP